MLYKQHINKSIDFIETIEKPYFVHLTPYGNFQVYVDKILDDYFIVKSKDSKEGKFFWMITAPRKGKSIYRLEKFESRDQESS